MHRHRHVYRHYEAAKPASSKSTCFRNCVRSEILPLGPHFYVHAFSWLSSVIWVVSWSLLKTSFFLINFLLHLSVLCTLTFSITSLTDFLNVFHLFILLFYTITLWAHFSYFCMGKELFLHLIDGVAPTKSPTLIPYSEFLGINNNRSHLLMYNVWHSNLLLLEVSANLSLYNCYLFACIL